jgi:hypothetical protein
MTLVENWKQAWKWFSMWAFAVCGSISLVWVNLPADVKNLIPDSWEKWVFIVIFLSSVLGGVGRLVDQTKGKAP